MTHDAFIGQFISAVRSELTRIQEDMVQAKFDDLYSVGQIQGTARGLQKALMLLEEAYREQDK